MRPLLYRLAFATRAIAVAGVFGAALWLAGCGEPARNAQFGGPTMGTSWSVQIVDSALAADADALQDDMAALLAAINAEMSTYEPGSVLSRFNASTSTDWFELSPDLYLVLEEALRIGRQTGGAFDVTVGPAVNLWGFGPDGSRTTVPTAAEVAAVQRRSGASLLMLRADPPAIRKARPDVYVDLSAIAKGHAVDRLADFLQVREVENYLVEVGGELSARGVNRRGEPWAVGVEKPVPGQRSVQRVVPLVNVAVATSGNYRNFFASDGQRFSHTIDPRTARPVAHALASATVLHSSAMTADALATALMVLGAEEGAALAERRGLAVLLIEEVDGALVERASSAYRRQVGEQPAD